MAFTLGSIGHIAAAKLCLHTFWFLDQPDDAVRESYRNAILNGVIQGGSEARTLQAHHPSARELSECALVDASHLPAFLIHDLEFLYF